MSEPDLSRLSGEQLHKEAKKADSRFGYHLDRVYVADPDLKAALDWMLAVESEQLRRRNGK
jgi:hypothetical protein